MKKLIIALALSSLVGGGAFAQLMFGVTGDLHMDTKMTASQIGAQFKDGTNIFYGPFVELAFGRLGVGLAGTFSFYTDYVLQTEFVNYDIAGFLSYHLFKARSFLDPFGELGYGYIASDYANSSLDPDTNNPESASLFWYGALGLGVNLGHIGFFGKMAYNHALPGQLDKMDSQGNTMTDLNGAVIKVPYYGYYDTYGNLHEYVPATRFTLGVKLIL